MEKPVYTLKSFLSRRFDFDVRKLPLHTFLGCPHRDGKSGGGCIYCNESGFSSIDSQERRIRDQIVRGIDESRKRGFQGRFIAYFQTGTNTCAEADLLESWWRTALEFPQDIVGLSVSTRPDCLDAVHLDILGSLSKNLMVWLELGLQSARDETLKRINRGHDLAAFVHAVEAARRIEGLHIVSHIILGLPGEGDEDMFFTIDTLNRLGVDGVKIHHLQVVQNTVLAEQYGRGEIKVFDEADYAALLARLIPAISRDMVIHRLIGDIHPDLLIAPRWKKPKTQVLQDVEKRLRSAGLVQGALVPG